MIVSEAQARSQNQTWLGEIYERAAPSYLMGDTPFLLMQWAHLITLPGETPRFLMMAARFRNEHGICVD